MSPSPAAEACGGPSVRRLGLLGGSFDPVHLGHLHVARAAEAAFQLERVLFVPAARPPHKPGRRLAEGVHRVAMLRLALAPHPGWCVDPLELERSGPSYTIDTVRELPERLGLAADCELFLLLGEDNLLGLERWREAQSLLLCAQPVVVHRPAADGALERRFDPERMDHLARELGPEVRARIERGLLAVDPLPSSSTAIRAAFARGERPDAELPAGVGEYARAHGLYGWPGSAAGEPP